MRRIGVALALSLVASLLAGTSALARANDIEWCAEDPVIVVFGSQLKVVTTVQAPEQNVSSFAYVVEVPSNAVGRTNVAFPHDKYSSTTVQVSYTGAAWDGTGTFAVSGKVTVSASGNPNVSVGVSGPAASAGTFNGTASAAVSFSTTLSPAASNAGGSAGQ